MVFSSQPNVEFARAPTRIYVWRHSLRVGVRADGKNRHGNREPLLGARRRAVRRRPRAPARRRQGAHAPRGGGIRHARRGRPAVPPAARAPGLRRALALEGRAHGGLRAEMALPPMRRQVQLPHRDGPRALQETASHLGRLHQADALRRVSRRLRGDVPHHPPDRLGVAAQALRRRRRLPGPHRAAGARLGG